MNLITNMKAILHRNPTGLAEDALGVAALGVMLIVALHLPGLM